MKFNIDLIKQFIELPYTNEKELRSLFDDAGLEVDEVTEHEGALVFNVEILANRGDHISALGVARELSARLKKPLNQIQLGQLPSAIESTDNNFSDSNFKVATKHCYSYSLFSLNIPQNFLTEKYVLKYLNNVQEDRAAIVNYLNYVQLEFGQPMHAFDAEKIEGQIEIVQSTEEEKIIALDGKEYTVPVDSILIRDQKKTIAVAGIIGCQNSMVDLNSTKILIEAATFDPICVRKTARKMGLATDASFIFERGCDPHGFENSLKRLVKLLGNNTNLTFNSFTKYISSDLKLNTFSIKYSSIAEMMNINLTNFSIEDLNERLTLLGYQLQPTNYKEVNLETDSIILTPPSWRIWNTDVQAVIIEDYLRAYGLNNINLDLPPLCLEKAPENSEDLVFKLSEPVLLGNGFNQVITRAYYSQADVKILSKLQNNIDDEHVKIANAIDSGYSHLKLTNIIHLAKLADWNIKHGIESIKLFEIGRLFSKSLPIKSKYEFEYPVLSLMFGGRWLNNSWKKPASFSDNYFYLKGVVESLFAAYSLKVSFQESSFNLMHPACQAQLVDINGVILGSIGAVHPLIKDSIGITTDMFYAEIYLDLVKNSQLAIELEKNLIFNDLPTIKRDLTLKFPKNVMAQEAVNFIREQNLDNLIQILLIDDFVKSEEDFRRTTFRLIYQSPSRTLTTNEVDLSFNSIVSQLKEEKSWERL